MPYLDRDPITHRITGEYGAEQYPGQEFLTDEQVAAEIAAYPPYDYEVAADIATYRDTKSGGTIEYNSVKASNDVDTQNVINRLIQYLLGKNDDSVTIDWKGPDGFYTATLSDLQGLSLIGGEIVEKAFTAEKLVLTDQATTPFATLAAAEAAFDTYFSS